MANLNEVAAAERRKWEIARARRIANEASEALQRNGRVSQGMAEDMRNSIRKLLGLLGEPTS